MELRRYIFSGLIGMLLLVPISYIFFRFLNLGESITGGVISDFPAAITAILGLLGLDGPIINIIAGILIGLALVFLFPIHWCILYRPDDIGLILAVTLPWILCLAITSALRARSPREGIYTSFAICIGCIILNIIIYFIMPLIVNALAPGYGSATFIILNGLSTGLTDLPYLLAVITAILEACLVGAVFGAFVGSLRYKGMGDAKKKKKIKVKVKEETTETSELISREIDEEKTIVTLASNTCSNCGANFVTEDLFCTNCGAKK